MKGQSIFNLFLLMLTVIFTVTYYDKFAEIDNIFYVLFWWLVLGIVVILMILPFIKSNDKEK